MNRTLAVFDLDDTLIPPPQQVFEHAIRRFAELHRLGASAHMWLTGQAMAAWSEGGLTYFAAVREHFGLAASAAALYETYRPLYLNAGPLFSGVVEGLVELRTLGVRTAIVTNGPTQAQKAKIEHLQLDRLVDAVCISAAEGCAKPDPEIFRRAGERAGAWPTRGWMIGDSLEHDIAGGRGAGLTTIWVRPNGRPRPSDEDAQPDHEVSHVTDAVKLVVEQLRAM